MTNITQVPTVNCPKVIDYGAMCEACTGITNIDSFTFQEGKRYVSVFKETGVQSINFSKVFKAGSDYNAAFANCKQLASISDQGLKDSFTILGTNHRDCFYMDSMFELPLSYTVNFRFFFPQSTDIAGCFRGTKALGLYGSKRLDFNLDAPYAKYANAFFWDTPIDLRPQRYFRSLVIGLQRCTLADGFFGAVKVDYNIYMEYVCPPSADSNVESILQTVEITPGRTGIEIYRNITQNFGQDMYDAVSQGIINAIISYGNNVWRGIWFDNLKVSIATISKIQNCSYFTSDTNPGRLYFNYCTFEDPEGLYTLQTPIHKIRIGTKGSTNLNIIQRGLTTLHTLSGD